MAPPLPFRWNARAYSYVNPANGRFVGSRTVRDAVDTALEGAKQETRALAESLRAGRISLAEWELGMAKQIRNTQGYAASLARGGFGQMGPADWGRVGSQVKKQLAYLRNFSAEVASGKQPMDGRFVRRATMYAEAARGGFHHAERREMDVRGFAEAKRVRNKTDSCDGCIREASRGFVPIDEVAPIGSQECRTSCGCYIAYRNPDTGQQRAA